MVQERGKSANFNSNSTLYCHEEQCCGMQETTSRIANPRSSQRSRRRQTSLFRFSSGMKPPPTGQDTTYDAHSLRCTSD